MAGIAVAIDWGDPRVDNHALDAMAAAMNYRAVDGFRAEHAAHVAFGFAAHTMPRAGRSRAQPWRNDEIGLMLVADGRIDNRHDLSRVLDVAQSCSDVELIAAAYLRWGDDTADHLVGDFAFAIWNARTRRLYAARDPFGIRPLFYATVGSRLYLASEVDALRKARNVRNTVDVAHLAEFATGSIVDPTRTMFESIRRIPGGHHLIATEGRCETRAWFAFPRETPPRDAQDDVEQFRARFLVAVADRLETDAVVVAQLSGGIDSASIAAAVHVLAREHPFDGSVTFASATYPGLACDERDAIEAVLARTRAPHVAWDATQISTGDDPLPAPALPWRDIQPHGANHTFAVARDRAARVVLTGHGGDELLHEIGAFTDHAARGRWGTLARETLRGDLYLGGSGHEYFRAALRSAFVSAVPIRLRTMYRQLRPATRREPEWFGPRLREAWMARPADTSPHAAPPDVEHVARHTWTWLMSPTGLVFREIDEICASRQGVELRHPFLDRRLAALVLSIPSERRIARGRIKRLVRDAFADELPPVVLQRTRVTTFEPAVVRFVVARLDSLEKFVEDPVGASIGWIDRGAARALCQRVRSKGCSADFGDCHELWSVASIELWLRTLEHEV
jgi:asparagine synthase (glutamine-hydrolysing)